MNSSEIDWSELSCVDYMSYLLLVVNIDEKQCKNVSYRMYLFIGAKIIMKKSTALQSRLFEPMI